MIGISIGELVIVLLVFLVVVQPKDIPRIASEAADTISKIKSYYDEIKSSLEKELGSYRETRSAIKEIEETIRITETEFKQDIILFENLSEEQVIKNEKHKRLTNRGTYNEHKTIKKEVKKIKKQAIQNLNIDKENGCDLTAIEEKV